MNNKTLIASVLWLMAVGIMPISAQDRALRSPSRVRPTATAHSNRPSPPAETTRVGSRLKNSVAPASAQMPAGGQVMNEGEYIEGEPYQDVDIHEHMPADHGGTCDGNCGGGCSSCSSEGYCSTCRSDRRFCICLPSHGWVHPEYLIWFQNGMNLPPLVTTSTGNNRATAGVLPAANVLYGGDNSALDGTRNGGRIRFGTWFDALPGVGLEGEYFGLAQKSEGFFQNSTGTPVLARPFFNIVTGLQDAELVAFPGVLSGSVTADVTSEFNGAAARLRRSLCCSNGCSYSPICCTTVPTSSRIDGTVGYRFYELKESLDVRENLTATDGNPARFNILDHFDTRNQFNGGELGVLWQGRRGLWSLDGLMRVGIGNNHQTVTIRGSTAITNTTNNTTTNFNNGILTQRTNIGSYDRNEFSMIPELGLTLGYQFTRRVRLTAGYSLIYWGNVVRPGDQVDLDVNPNLFPPEANPLTGALRPQFQFVSSDYWVQGMSFGADVRW